MKVVIAIPCDLMKNSEIKSMYDDIASRLRALKHEPFPYINTIEANTGSNELLYRIGETVKQMTMADAVYFDYDWEKSPFCMVLHFICENYGLNSMYNLS